LVAFFYGDGGDGERENLGVVLKRAAGTGGWSPDDRSLGWLTGNLGMP
jgi:hypothetical protein